jgi:hypothetical protein
MDRPGHEGIKFFTGKEVEHTPAYGLDTLFVVGIQPVEDIEFWAKRSEVSHVYFGANQSFPNPAVNDSAGWKPWEHMIGHMLDLGYLCTLDVDSSAVEGLLESFLVESNNFIPMISVKIPYIRQLNYNATLKIDDKDFAATNPGVWCHSLQNLQKRSVFTDWSKYSKDSEIK